MGIITNFLLKLKVARCIKKGQASLALERLEQLLAQEGPSAFIYWLMAWCHESLDDMASAVSAGKEALALEPDHYESLKLMAGVYHRLDEYDKAKDCVIKSLRHCPAKAKNEDKDYLSWAANYLSWYDMEFNEPNPTIN